MHRIERVILVGVLLSCSVRGATLNWAGGDGNFLEEGCWTGGGVPSEGDTVRFQGVGAVRVGSAGDVSIQSMSVSDSWVEMNWGGKLCSLAGAANVSATAAHSEPRGLVFSNGVFSVGGRLTGDRRSEIRFVGENTHVEFSGDQVNLSGGSVMYVESGATATNSASVNLSVGNGLAGGIVIDGGEWDAINNFGMSGNATAIPELIIRNGGMLHHSKSQRFSANAYTRIVVEGEGSLLEANQLAMQNTFAKIEVRDGARATASWCFWLGRGGNSYSNELVIADGGSAKGPIWFGYNSENTGWPSSNNTVRVSNGNLEITGNPFNLRDECNLMLQGTNTVVTTQGAMRIFRGARILFFPPTQKQLANVPLSVKGAITQIDEDCTFVVDSASALDCAKQGGGNFTVVTMNANTSARFAYVEAPSYVHVEQTDRAIRVRVDCLLATQIYIR